MPNVKSQFDRYELLVALLKTKHTKKELLEKYFDNGFEVHWRTLNNDITYLKDEGAEIHTPNRTDPYYYFENEYIPEGSSFTDEDVETLQQSIQILSNTIGFKTGLELKEILLKSKFLKYHFNKKEKPIISFEKQSITNLTKHLDNLYNTVANKDCLKINYTPNSSEIPVDYIISPYYLKEYRNRWYLLGLKNCDHFLMNLALDRINKISPADNEQYIENESFDFDQMYKFVVGVTIPMNSKPQIIKAIVSKVSANYIKSKPFIDNQEIIEEHQDGSILIQFTAYENYELVQSILSYGSAIKIIEPQSLKDKLFKTYQEAIRQYKS
ncbi:MAG: WYL domain-containing protein [Bacteroidales bacterium]|nr:WYL domain-containing protein [Bacteroidales bacterium]MDY0215626.1 WYL domain-containing protein [Bacteroidales bacterium]